MGNVDREMSAIRDGGRVKARERIAVLAALNLAYALAERPPAAASSSSKSQAAVAAPAAATGGDQPDIDALIARVDHALGADGQLL